MPPVLKINPHNTRSKSQHTLRPKTVTTKEKSAAKPGFFGARNCKVLKALNIQHMQAGNYIQSPLDRPDLVIVKEVHLLSRFNGRGLFARKVILQGTCIGQYTGRLFQSEDDFKHYLKADSTRDNHYAMTCGKQLVDAQIQGNFTRYINFSETQANVAFVESTYYHKPVIKIIALKDIQPGEQLLVDYNILDEQASKTYAFLNPEDNEQSVADYLRQHKKHYYAAQIQTGNLARFGFGQQAMVTDLLMAIMRGVSLSSENNPQWVAEINMPCIAMQNKRPCSFLDKDVLSPLMLAVQLGNPANIAWLAEQGARIDRQQNHSGLYALSLALLRYGESSTRQAKCNYVKIITCLLSHGASPLMYDRNNAGFLHLCVKILSATDFETVVNCFKEKQPAAFEKAYECTDEEDKDPLICAMECKNITALKKLIQMNPAAHEAYFQKASEDAVNNRELLQKTVTRFFKTSDDRQTLIQVMPVAASVMKS